MEIIDLHDPSRVNRNPDEVKFLLQNGNFIQDEFKIFDIELIKMRLITTKNFNWIIVRIRVRNIKIRGNGYIIRYFIGRI